MIRPACPGDIGGAQTQDKDRSGPDRADTMAGSSLNRTGQPDRTARVLALDFHEAPIFRRLVHGIAHSGQHLWPKVR